MFTREFECSRKVIYSIYVIYNLEIGSYLYLLCVNLKIQCNKYKNIAQILSHLVKLLALIANFKLHLPPWVIDNTHAKSETAIRV